MTCEPDRSSVASEEWTSGSHEPDSNTASSRNPTATDATCSQHDGPECPCTTTYAQLQAESIHENDRKELRLSDIAFQLTTGGGKPGQGYSAVLISSAAASPAKTSQSPDNAEDSPENDPGSSTSSPASQTLFNPDGYSSRTYPDCSPRTAVGTSESLLERWPTSGTAWHGGFSTHVSSECRSDDDACTSSEPSLTEILQPPHSVPARYSLSARAARGILRRAEKRGRTLPTHLMSALRSVATQAEPDRHTTPPMSQEPSETLLEAGGGK